MGGACSKHRRNEKCIQNFGRKIRREETTRKTGRRWEDNIRMDLREMSGNVWAGNIQDRDQCQALVIKVMKLRVP